tara:strand:+ start:1038 stop:1409 length:372 start_codon:yes stop_codon:yes gene_type:complete
MSEIEEVVRDLAIRQFKLMNGDEIICLVASNNETNFVVDRPFRVEVNKHKADAYQLVPWFDLSLSNTFTIDKSMVVAHADVANQIKETYIKFAVSLDKDLSPSEDSEDNDMPNLIPNQPDSIH